MARVATEWAIVVALRDAMAIPSTRADREHPACDDFSTDLFSTHLNAFKQEYESQFPRPRMQEIGGDPFELPFRVIFRCCLVAVGCVLFVAGAVASSPFLITVGLGSLGLFLGGLYHRRPRLHSEEEQTDALADAYAHDKIGFERLQYEIDKVLEPRRRALLDEDIGEEWR